MRVFVAWIAVSFLAIGLVLLVQRIAYDIRRRAYRREVRRRIHGLARMGR